MANAEIQRRTGRLTAVFHPVGTFEGGARKLKRANFDLLQWASTEGGISRTYVVTRGFERITSAELQAGFIPGNVAAEAIDVGSEFGFYGDGYEVVEYGGQGAGVTDSWKGLHAFGPI